MCDAWQEVLAIFERKSRRLDGGRSFFIIEGWLQEGSVKDEAGAAGAAGKAGSKRLGASIKWEIST